MLQGIAPKEGLGDAGRRIPRTRHLSVAMMARMLATNPPSYSYVSFSTRIDPYSKLMRYPTMKADPTVHRGLCLCAMRKSLKRVTGC